LQKKVRLFWDNNIRVKVVVLLVFGYKKCCHMVHFFNDPVIDYNAENQINYSAFVVPGCEKELTGAVC